ncbi:MAG: penicillin-binding protein activator [Rickettsiales bacterium]|jgi:outer membrane PBP1 activator LpoA protein|nr:penicillin-binding protein activator [Rickettsiales bacterium]
MFKKLRALLLAGLVASCGGGLDGEWGGQWGSGPVAAPDTMESDPSEYGMTPETDANELRTVAVLLPLSGANGNLGAGIQHAIEIAFFQKQPKNIMVSFHDLSGADEQKRAVIDMVVANKPNLIIGPLFADDAEMLKDRKPADLPALAFTSAKSALGGGIFTLALLPNQAAEAVVKQIAAEEKKSLLILAPDSPTGWMLANNAVESAHIYGVKLAGLYMYEEQNSEKMKHLAEEVSLSEPRISNLTHAKEILSDVLISQKLTGAEKESVRSQLEDLNKKDALGDPPYDAVLMLGTAMDSKTIAAYLRYYDVSAAKVSFYGSALWDTDVAYRDAALAGGEYAALPRISDGFAKLYAEIEGEKPNRFNSIGYDAAMLAIKALSGSKPAGAYLLDPSGYNGLDGLVRLRPNGENERALQIMQLNGVRLPMIKTRAPANFIKPIYQTTGYDLSSPSQKKLTSDGYKPTDYIRLPEHLAGKYQSKSYGVAYDESVELELPQSGEHIEVISEDPEAAIMTPGFEPTKLDGVDRKMIDEVKLKAN